MRLWTPSTGAEAEPELNAVMRLLPLPAHYTAQLLMCVKYIELHTFTHQTHHRHTVLERAFAHQALNTLHSPDLCNAWQLVRCLCLWSCYQACMQLRRFNHLTLNHLQVWPLPMLPAFPLPPCWPAHICKWSFRTLSVWWSTIQVSTHENANH